MERIAVPILRVSPELIYSFEISMSALPVDAQEICGDAIEKLPLGHLQRFYLIGSAHVAETAYLKLSQAPNLATLAFRKNELGVIDLICDLVDRILQCNAHNQEHCIQRTLHIDRDGDGNSLNEGEDEDDTERVYEYLNGDGTMEDESTGDIHSEGDAPCPHQRRRRGNMSDDEYWALRDDVQPCDKGRELSKAFFPSLRRLIPLAEFVVRRIRCCLPLEKITFELHREKHWEYKQQPIVTELKELCGDLKPMMTYETYADSDDDSSEDDEENWRKSFFMEQY